MAANHLPHSGRRRIPMFVTLAITGLLAGLIVLRFLDYLPRPGIRDGVDRTSIRDVEPVPARFSSPLPPEGYVSGWYAQFIQLGVR